MEAVLINNSVKKDFHRKGYYKEWCEKNRERHKETVKKWYSMNRVKCKERGKLWRTVNKERISIGGKKRYIENRDRILMDRKRRHWELKVEILRNYGGDPPKCACCGEVVVEFLSIDHIDGKGNLHRKEIRKPSGITFYRWLKKSGFPSGYRVLCFNCNLSLGFFGYCPHQGGNNGSLQKKL